jgi:hypothetical protein
MPNPKLTKQVLSALNPNSYLKQDQGKMLNIQSKISEYAKQKQTKGNEMLAKIGKSTVNAWQKTKKKGAKVLKGISLKKRATSANLAKK